HFPILPLASFRRSCLGEGILSNFPILPLGSFRIPPEGRRPAREPACPNSLGIVMRLGALDLRPCWSVHDRSVVSASARRLAGCLGGSASDIAHCGWMPAIE